GNMSNVATIHPWVTFYVARCDASGRTRSCEIIRHLGGASMLARFLVRSLLAISAIVGLCGLRADANPVLPARAFTGGGDRVMRLVSDKPTVCIQLEPVNGSFELREVEL